MNAYNLINTFEERLQEIDSYMGLLAAIELQVQNGAPPPGGLSVNTQQQKILYSSVYLQLYNLVESTLTKCIEAISSATAVDGKWKASDLSCEIGREWARNFARTHTEKMSSEKRLVAVERLLGHVANGHPVANWQIEKGGGGNWDDLAIEKFATRIGFSLIVSDATRLEVRRFIREEKGALGLIKLLRNRLAHGSLSFSECGDGVTVADLNAVKTTTAKYLREVVQTFSNYIDDHGYLRPEVRPGVR